MKAKNTDCCSPVDNSATCGCCDGVEVLTPLSTYNRPGLSALNYRIGSHGSFLETMTARLTGFTLEKKGEAGNADKNYPLQGLTTRNADDPALAMLDAWATVADVLTFYQERIANEGYLRTATERRSVLEMARLVGYKPRPGVSASVFLAYTLDENFKGETLIPVGSRSQSIPEAGELPQTFEISEDLKARSQWNNLKPRDEKPQNIDLSSSIKIAKIYLAGSAIQLSENEPVLLVFGDEIGEKVVRIVTQLNADFDKDKAEACLLEIPFLITFAIDLLRPLTVFLGEGLKTPDLKQVSDIKNIRNVLLEYLENFSLGKYPPINTSFFSHERIYDFLCLFIIRKTNTYASMLYDSGIKASDTGILSMIQDTLLVTLTNLLSDEFYQKKFICLFRYVIKQLYSKNNNEKQCLRSFVVFLASGAVNNSLSQELRVFLISLLAVEELTLLLRDLALKNDLTDFISKELLPLPYEDDENTIVDFFIDMLDWLANYSVNQDNVQCGTNAPLVTSIGQLTESLLIAPSLQPRHATSLPRSASRMFGANSAVLPQTLIGFKPQLSKSLNLAWRNASVVTISPVLKSIHALGLTAPLFGYNAPVKMGLKVNTDSSTNDIQYISVPDGDWVPTGENSNQIFLDNAYKDIQKGANLVIRDEHSNIYMAARAEQLITQPRSAYTISGKSTLLSLSRQWWQSESLAMNSIRKTEVWIETAELTFAQEPVTETVSGDCIELNSIYDDLDGGRWLIVSGERADISATSGIQFSELVMLANVEHIYDEDLPGDTPHTKIRLAEKLSYSFKRDTVTINANVVKATHGETRHEALGSGHAAKPFQSFELKQFPLTHVSASNPTGIDSTLKVFVNELQWHESDALAGLAATDRQFISKTDNEDKTKVIFGNGKKGARLPTGVENIKATYRSGIGKTGNVKAEQISMLMDKPLGVKEVVNPLQASGGANRETRDQARKHVPLAVKALDRLVSVQDYEDFSRIYAGIGKAHAVELSNGRQPLVHVTIAGAEDIPIAENSDLYRNLRRALHDFGDPYQAIQLAIRELMFVVIEAKVAILPDYQWQAVEADIRVRVLDTFSFERRELGQDVMLSEVISVMQSVHGVAYVDVDSFGGIPEKTANESGERRLLIPDEIAKKVSEIVAKQPIQQILPVNLAGIVNQDNVDIKHIRPAQIAFLTPDVSATLILNQIESLL